MNAGRIEGGVKVGVTLPQFRDDAAGAIAAAAEAERLGIDGVFVFDHLWPIGGPGRPIVASLPLLGAIAAETERIVIGSLVMRVGLLPDDMLLEELGRVDDVSGGRFVAGLGTGDRLSADENRAFGVPYGSAEERRETLHRCAASLRARGHRVWIGAGATVDPRTREVAHSIGAALNAWDTGVATVEAETEVEMTWGGPVAGGAVAVAERVRELARAGATWVVCGWPDSLTAVADARRMVADEGL